MSSTSDKIAAAAHRLLEAEGSEAVTMRRVAEAVGITAMAVYRHYPNRAGLLNALADEGFTDLADRLKRISISGKLEERMVALLDVYLQFGFERPRLFELMFLEQREGARQFPQDFEARRSPTANLVAEMIEEGMQTGVLRRDAVWELNFEMGALLQGMMMLYLGGRVAMSPEEFRGLCHRSFRRYLYGVRA